MSNEIDTTEDRREAIEAGRTETEIVNALRENAKAAVEAEAKLIGRLGDVPAKDIPSALRAASDTRAKSIDNLLKMTGRQTDGGESIAHILQSMQKSGLVKINVELEFGGEISDDPLVRSTQPPWKKSADA